MPAARLPTHGALQRSRDASISAGAQPEAMSRSTLNTFICLFSRSNAYVASVQQLMMNFIEAEFCMNTNESIQKICKEIFKS